MFLESCMIHCSIVSNTFCRVGRLPYRQDRHGNAILFTIVPNHRAAESSPGDTICIGESSRTDFEAGLPVLAIIILDPFGMEV